MPGYVEMHRRYEEGTGGRRFVLSHVTYHVQINTPTRIEGTRVSDDG